MTPEPQDVSKIYHRRFARTMAYRNRVWKVLTRVFFSRWVAPGSTVLDLGCGYGEFINNIVAREKLAMDLNPDAPGHIAPGTKFLLQNSATRWPLSDDCLDVVFSSNFFEHLTDKGQLDLTLREILRCLKPGGRLIAVGPNIKFLHGIYWDFYDHHIYLTEASLGEALEIEGFRIEHITPKFLPFTMVKAPQYPMLFVRLYIAFPWVWRILGKQFLVIARKPAAAGGGVESEFRVQGLGSRVSGVSPSTGSAPSINSGQAGSPQAGSGSSRSEGV